MLLPQARVTLTRMNLLAELTESVMPHHGPHVLDALRTLDDVLHRVRDHQRKKRPLLLSLKSWNRLRG